MNKHAPSNYRQLIQPKADEGEGGVLMDFDLPSNAETTGPGRLRHEIAREFDARLGLDRLRHPL